MSDLDGAVPMEPMASDSKVHSLEIKSLKEDAREVKDKWEKLEARMTDLEKELIKVSSTIKVTGALMAFVFTAAVAVLSLVLRR